MNGGLLAGAVGIAFATGLGMGLSVAAVRRARMRRVGEGVAELARGNLGHRVILPGDDDAARIAVGINTLADAFQAEREAATARDDARRRLLANISHDLRTPIASVAGYVDALQRGLGDDPDRYLSVIAAKTDELAELTDDLFYEARLDSGDLELKRVVIDLAEAVRRSLLGFEPQLAGRGVSVSASIPENPCPVEADASAVSRVLDNLISNSLRHATQMTTLAVEMLEGPDDYAVRIVNDGVAVPPDAERLFQRGVAGGGGGAGLGLSIARDLALRMNASVGVDLVGESVIAFTLRFPRGARQTVGI